MTNDQVITLFVTWLEKVLPNYPIIRGYQGGQAPAGIYVVVHLVGVDNVRTHEQRFVETDADTGDIDTGDVYPDHFSAPALEKNWRFMLTCYGDKDDASQPLRIVDAARRLTQVLEPLEPNFSIHDMGGIVQTGAMKENGWKQQASAQVTLRGLTTDAFEIDIISAIEGVTVTRI